MCRPAPRPEQPPPPRWRGFTLIEVLVIISTLGLLSSIAVATYQRVSGQAPPHNAARDMVQAMERARARAIEKKTDVWMIVYPGFNKRSNTVTAGRGGWFVVEDTGHDFNATTGAAPNLYYRSGLGRQFDPTTGSLQGPNAKVIESRYLEDYGGRIRYRLPRSTIDMGEPEAPFAGLVIRADCTFCTTGSRGAIVFGADGSIRFLDGSGEPVEGDAKAHALVLLSDRSKYTSVVAVSAAAFDAFRK